MVGYNLKGNVNMARLDSLSVSGFESIREMDSLPLTKLNLLIGANGSGKSNFLELFKLLRASMQLPLLGFTEIDLKKYVLDSGVAADFLYKEKPEATQISFKLDFGVNGYGMVLVPTQKEHHFHTFFYSQIVDSVRQVAPFFDDFMLEANPQDLVRLLWKQKGSDYPMKPQSFSDGTLRFICLATVLLQPKHPDLIIIDEPELGLHPYAIGLLAELMQARSTDTQLIVATQSPALISHFKPEDIIVCDRMEGQSTFTRLNSDSLDVWLEDYSLGELWTKNILSGGPIHE